MQLPTLFKPSKTYILAVSGGVDSMVLLDLVAHASNGATIIVAHFDHAMRPDSPADAELVKSIAASFNLEYRSERAGHGAITSELSARRARYDFLNKLRLEYNAEAIVTAHHQDDIIETMLINLLRGTNRKGLSSLASHQNLLRPFLDMSKEEIIAYARANGVRWNEDSTNTDTQYLRNWIRSYILPKLSDAQRQQLLVINRESLERNVLIDELLDTLILKIKSGHGINIPRYEFIMLDRSVAFELLARYFRAKKIEVSEKLLYKTWLFAKTARKGASLDVAMGVTCQIDGKTVVVTD